jgi:pilus assembly protein Flp/PilA
MVRGDERRMGRASIFMTFSKIVLNLFTAWKAGMGTIPYGRAGGPQGEQTMRRLVSSFLKNELGATAIEYSIIASGIALAIVAALNGIGSAVKTPLTTVQTGLK